MNFEFFPKVINKAINCIDYTKLSEIRLRTNFAIILNYDNDYVYLKEDGITIFEREAIICDSNLINYIVNELTEHSLYAFNDRIKEGYLTSKNGVRVGVAGECVFDGDKILTIKNITSLLIRIPHDVKNCSNEIYKNIVQEDNIFNTLILSSVGRGKTTILKDLALKLNDNYKKSILIIDERGEFSNIVGKRIDVIRYSNKLYAFNYAIRSMAPDIVITDELCSKNDWLCAMNAVNSGAKIIATCHAEDVKRLQLKDVFIDGIFDKYVFLKSTGYPGKINIIYDRGFKVI